MIGGLLGLATQTSIGAAIDETRAKRGVIILALSALALGAVTIFVRPSFWPVLVANSLIAVVGDVFGPRLPLSPSASTRAKSWPAAWVVTRLSITPAMLLSR